MKFNIIKLYNSKFNLIVIIISFNVISAYANTVSGYIYDGSTNLPINSATIMVGNDGYPPKSIVYYDTTDAMGYYKIENIPVYSDYTILVSAIGYESKELRMQTPPKNIDFYLDKPNSGYLVRTVNQGLKLYNFNRVYSYRVDGLVDNRETFFPNIDAESDTTSIFLSMLGAGKDTTSNDSLIWEKITIVWNWLQQNTIYNTNDPNWQTANDYMMQYGYPSIEMIGKTFLKYNFIPWGTCMHRAHIFTTLLYRCGISKDRLAIAETRWRLRYSQHMYTIVFLANRWLYVDPSFNHLSIPSFSSFHSIPLSGWEYSDYRDYNHPLEITIIPKSNLSEVPEITSRPTNTTNIFINEPPTNTHTISSTINLSGFTSNTEISQVSVNGVMYSITNTVFNTTIPLQIGNNLISAGVTYNNNTYIDSISVCREVNSTTNINEQEPPSSLQQYHLYQNYPNPFNPSTKIMYAISSQRYTTLKVYNVLGNEITTLVNEEKSTGIYEVEFDASNLPSGFYLYQLQAGDFLSTKKMILLK